ncbi:hypothetical protein [Brevibacillus laterosporus]|uniref:hypothetical protein n=1 Tax=Brevibacillus laterosporus TaxID=1465 RepID=UPI003D194B1E
MANLDIFEHRHIDEVREVVGEWELLLREQTVKVKILKISDKYYYRTSHYYKSSNQASPVMSTVNGSDTITEALLLARQQIICTSYDPQDKNAKWIPNERY